MTKFNCPRCEAEQEVGKVDLGEHFVDLPDNCEECNYVYTDEESMELYEKIMENAYASAIDRAEYLIQDR